MLRSLGESAAAGRHAAWSDDAALDRLVARAVAGEPDVVRVVVAGARALGRGLATLVQAMNPARVVVGGPLARLWPIAADPVRDELARWSSVARMSDVSVEASSLGERAAVLGAVSVVLQQPERFLGRREGLSPGPRAR
jgi:predicted NBD/HSP70 family sugar kinase